MSVNLGVISALTQQPFLHSKLFPSGVRDIISQYVEEGVAFIFNHALLFYNFRHRNLQLSKQT